MEDIYVIIVFAIIFGVGFVTVIIKAVVGATKSSAKSQETQTKSTTNIFARPNNASAGKTTMTDEQRRRLDYLREQLKQREADEKHERHQADAHEHGHAGEEEHYEEIVGSLGEINDEGCEDLNGVRFIAHDLAYDASEGGEHDYAELAKAMVLGDVINTPRFKGLKRP